MFCTPYQYTGLKIVHQQPKACTKCEATKKRREKFIKDLQPFVQTYGKQMMNSFFKYWSELNKSGSKMRFELERTWELPKRLQRWEANNKFESKKNGMPDKFDPMYETTLDEAGRSKYHNHLRSIGWQYVQAPGAYGWGWKKINN